MTRTSYRVSKTKQITYGQKIPFVPEVEKGILPLSSKMENTQTTVCGREKQQRKPRPRRRGKCRNTRQRRGGSHSLNTNWSFKRTNQRSHSQTSCLNKEHWGRLLPMQRWSFEKTILVKSKSPLCHSGIKANVSGRQNMVVGAAWQVRFAVRQSRWNCLWTQKQQLMRSTDSAFLQSSTEKCYEWGGVSPLSRCPVNLLQTCMLSDAPFLYCLFVSFLLYNKDCNMGQRDG